VAIRIDVHPAGENPTNTTRTLPMPVHVCPAYASCGRSPYLTTFRESSIGLDGCTAPEKSAPDSTSQPGWVVRGTCLSFSPNTAIEAVRLPGPYHHHAIGTFNTCSRVPNPQSLTDTGRGYHIENLRIDTALSPPIPSEGFTDPLMAPPGLRLSNINIQG
jgi:hypothetical protein